VTTSAPWRWILILVSALFLTHSGQTQAEHPGSIPPASGAFMTSLSAAAAVAADEGRPLFIFFTANWCKPCHRMKAEVLSDARVRIRLARFIRVQVNADSTEGKKAWQTYRVSSLPTTIIAASDRPDQVARRIEGLRTIQELTEDLDHVIEALAVPAPPGRERLSGGGDTIPRAPEAAPWPWWVWLLAGALTALGATIVAGHWRTRGQRRLD